jgi:hypothetical protein
VLLLEAVALSAFPSADLLPDPSSVHRRLGEVLREQRLLRRLLRLTLAAREEQRRQEQVRERQVPNER